MILGPVSALDIQYNTCPVCGYYCLNTRASFDICFMCFWEDDWLEAYEPEKKESFLPESTPYFIQKLWQEMDEQIEGQNASATDRLKIILEEIRSLLQHKGLYKFMDMT
ncbi:CPCC family cysteine-rich protein [Edaphocola aurantiacus]|uniref:CPCC family cysteine-rich protein n=1 Tax=Edaphocola aurantiacus TaxID=2601682 RepID=UPI001C98CE29|nr:CPCC family cysteine-rich protein [Edaphocola aurantiacus]